MMKRVFMSLLLAVGLFFANVTSASAAQAVIIDVGVVEAAEQCGEDAYPILERISGGQRVWICGQRAQR